MSVVHIQLFLSLICWFSEKDWIVNRSSNENVTLWCSPLIECGCIANWLAFSHWNVLQFSASLLENVVNYKFNFHMRVYWIRFNLRISFMYMSFASALRLVGAYCGCCKWWRCACGHVCTGATKVLQGYACTHTIGTSYVFIQDRLFCI